MNYISVVKKLIDNKIKISVAESLTGGLIVKMITDVPGSSAILDESYVTYSNESKTKLLGVDKKTIDAFGVVSAEVAKEMATGIMNKTKVDISISTTGNAGPTVCDDKPVGRAYIGIAYNGNRQKGEGKNYNVRAIEVDVETNYNDTEESIFKNRSLVREEVAKRVFEEVDKIIKNELA